MLDQTTLKGQRKWFKQEKGLPHRGYLPSPGGLPTTIASEEECVARWGERKGSNGFKVQKTYKNYAALKKRYEDVHQRPLPWSIPLHFALGWVAEEKHGPDAIDWATFACWRSNNHDGPFEALEERESRLKEEERERVNSGRLKHRGRPSRSNRGRDEETVRTAKEVETREISEEVPVSEDAGNGGSQVHYHNDCVESVKHSEAATQRSRCDISAVVGDTALQGPRRSNRLFKKRALECDNPSRLITPRLSTPDLSSQLYDGVNECTGETLYTKALYLVTDHNRLINSDVRYGSFAIALSSLVQCQCFS